MTNREMLAALTKSGRLETVTVGETETLILNVTIRAKSWIELRDKLEAFAEAPLYDTGVWNGTADLQGTYKITKE